MAEGSVCDVSEDEGFPLGINVEAGTKVEDADEDFPLGIYVEGTGTKVQDAVKEWDENRPVVLVVAGKKGIGKSTLINNLLDLKEEEMAKTACSADAIRQWLSLLLTLERKEMYSSTVSVSI